MVGQPLVGGVGRRGPGVIEAPVVVVPFVGWVRWCRVLVLVLVLVVESARVKGRALGGLC